MWISRLRKATVSRVAKDVPRRGAVDRHSGLPNWAPLGPKLAHPSALWPPQVGLKAPQSHPREHESSPEGPQGHPSFPEDPILRDVGPFGAPF